MLWVWYGVALLAGVMIGWSFGRHRPAGALAAAREALEEADGSIAKLLAEQATMRRVAADHVKAEEAHRNAQADAVLKHQRSVAERDQANRQRDVESIKRVALEDELRTVRADLEAAMAVAARIDDGSDAERLRAIAEICAKYVGANAGKVRPLVLDVLGADYGPTNPHALAKERRAP